MNGESYAGDLTEIEGWRILAEDQSSILIDVRTLAEWTYVGIPDIGSLGKKVIFVPWLSFPSMEINPLFVEQLKQAGAEESNVLLFLCRSGVRSKSAAQAMTRIGFSRCFNLKNGFEGNLDTNRHRGSTEGWKVAGLPWVQT